MRPGIFQPFQNQQSALAGERPQNPLDIIARQRHIAN
jgi:hypothetical protein